MKRLRTSLCFRRRLVNKTVPWATTLMSAVLAAACLSTTVEPAQVRNPFGETISGYRVNGVNLIEALQEASYRYRLPVGIEADLQEKGSKQVSLNMPSGTAADLFDALIRQTPDYQWNETNGVADVTRRKGVTSIIDVKVKRIHLASATPDMIHNAIVSLPEVQTWLRENHITERSNVTGSILVGRNNQTDQPRASINASDVSLKEILNAIVKKAGFHYWIVGHYEDHGQYLSIGVS